MSNHGTTSKGNVRRAIILAAGESKRTRPLTNHRPKPLIPLLGKPLLAHILDTLVGIADRVTLVVGYRAEAIATTFGSTYRGMGLDYVHQQVVNGTAGALLAVGPISEPFLLLYGDNLIAREDVLGVCRQPDTLAGLHVSDARAFGVLQIADGSVRGILEKPEHPPENALANPGIFHFSADAATLVRQISPSPRGELELTDLIGLLAATRRVAYHVCTGYWIPVGTPWEALSAAQFLLALRRTHNQQASIDPTAKFHSSAYVTEASRIEASALIAADATIHDCVIGPGTRIGAGAVIERSIVEAGALVEAGAYIRDSVVGPGAIVGERATVAASWLDDAAVVTSGSKLEAAVFADLRPVAVTHDQLSPAQLSTRGAIVARAVSASGTIAPGSVISE